MYIPTWEDSVIRGYGGLCYSLCLFMKYLLEALGYDVYFVACNAFSCPGNHIHPGSHHIVDNIAFQHLKQFLLTLRLTLQSTVTPTLSTSF